MKSLLALLLLLCNSVLPALCVCVGGGGALTCRCVQKLESGVWMSFHITSLPYSLRHSLQLDLNLEVWQDWPTKEPLAPACFYHLSAGLQACTTMPSLYMGFGWI